MLIPMRLWLGGLLIGLAVLLLLIQESSFIRRLYLSLRTKLRDFRVLMRIVLTRRKWGHTAHQGVKGVFNLKLDTPEDVRKDMQAKDESLQKQIDELKRDKKKH